MNDVWELIERHLDLVYSAALRNAMTADPHDVE
jgi:hypothetical protein